MKATENGCAVRQKIMKIGYAVRLVERGPVLHKEVGAIVPRIRMEGKWLDRLGFRVGEMVSVEYGLGYLHINLVDSGIRPAVVCESRTEYVGNSVDRRHSEGGEGSHGGQAGWSSALGKGVHGA